MDNIPEDIILSIVSFLKAKDVYSTCLLSKKIFEIFTSESIWSDLGQRDYPFLEIKSLRDYVKKNPMYVYEQELQKYIGDSEWAKKWIGKKKINYNGVNEHRYKAYVESIGKDIIRVKHYRALKERFPNAEMDWKIGINIIIDDLLTRTENEEKELKSI